MTKFDINYLYRICYAVRITFFFDEPDHPLAYLIPVEEQKKGQKKPRRSGVGG